MRRILLLTTLFLACADPARAQAPLLIENGQPRAQIVLSENPARMARLAARELQTYLEKISGARLEIVTAPDDDSASIFVGESRFTEELKLSTDGLEHGSYRMASGKDWLALLGPDEDYVPIEPWGRKRGSAESARVNAEWDRITGDTFWNNLDRLYTRYHADLDVWDYDDTGTLNAVHEFLRSLGVRWYAPGESGEVVPRQANVPLPEVNRTVRPDFPLRRISYFTEHLGLGEVALWNLRLGLNYGHDLIGVTQPGHGIKFVLWREEMKKAHPEMYLLRNGKPDTTHKGTGAPCLTSPLLFEKQLNYSRAMLDHFRQPMISIDMVDGYGGMVCEHEACRKLMTPDRGWPGSMSDYVWGYQNRIAQELHQSHPDRMVSGLAYSSYKLPPEQIPMMSPNLAIIECRARSRFFDEEIRQESRDVRAAWLEKLPSRQYFTWDYYLSAVPEVVGRPVFIPRLIASDLRELKGVSLGDSIEVYLHQPGKEEAMGYDALAVEHLNLYITSRLWWDSEQDVDALLEDYYSAFYGPAAGAMQAFIEFSEANWMHMHQDAEKNVKAFTLLKAAQEAVDPASAEGRRIQKIATLMTPLRSIQQALARKRSSDVNYRILETRHSGSKPMKEKMLDGRLSKEFWPEVRVSTLAPVVAGKKPKGHSQFRALREGNMLYFGIHCSEPDMAGLRSTTTQPDDPKLLEGDYMSLLIETPTRSFYEIAVNPAGAVLEIDHAEGGGISWTSGAQVAVHRDKDFWSVEIRVPIAGEGARLLDPNTGIDGDQPKDLFPWYFNVCRHRVREEGAERTALSVDGPENFRAPEAFAKLWGK